MTRSNGSNGKGAASAALAVHKQTTLHERDALEVEALDAIERVNDPDEAEGLLNKVKTQDCRCGAAPSLGPGARSALAGLCAQGLRRSATARGCWAKPSRGARWFRKSLSHGVEHSRSARISSDGG